MKNETINKFFESQVENTPNNIALVCGTKRITYEELNQEANKRANYLISKNVKKEEFVGIVMDHSIDMIINIFAVIKSGAGYVPMEPTFPRERINYIVEQANLKYIFTQNKYKDIFNRKDILIFEDENYKDYSKNNTCNVNDGSNAIYVLYTSGTTGTPKGIVVEQHNVCNYVKAFKKEFKITEEDKMLQNSVCTFDIFTEELFPILLTGGTLVIARDEEKRTVEKLVDLIEKEQVTIITGFPYLLSDINNYKIPESLKLAISGGDTLRKEHVSNLLKKVKVYNTYGPTETTVCISYYHYTDENIDSKTVPIGKNIYGTRMYVLDENLQKVKPNEIGEICISGNCVTRGYLNEVDETKKSFIDYPFEENERMYKSGDLGLLREDGNVEFIKRKDKQVMILGKRVEPFEVENAMYKYIGINLAVVKSYLDTKEYPYLVGYYSSKKDIKIHDLKHHLSKYLPEFMIPEFFVKLHYVPKTANGKIDKKFLPIVLK